MSKGYRDGAFALGIVVGGGIVLNLFLWLSYAARHKIESNYPSGQNAQDGQDASLWWWWWRWTGDLVSSGDTLAQWIMAFFTIGATIVLIFTLRSANRTNLAAIKASNAALEANQIMRDEQRPWVTLERDTFCDFRDNGHGCNIIWNINFRNRGKIPAHNVRFNWKVVKCHRATLEASMIQNFAVECIENPRFFNTPIIFPDERTDFLRNRKASFRYGDDEIASDDVQFMILTCITYESPGIGNDIGVEAAAFTVAHKGKFGPFSAKVLEYNWSRYVR